MPRFGMERLIGRLAPHLFAILRIVAGLMFALHGTQKFFGWPGGKQTATQPLMLLAGTIELVGGLLIAIGLFASWAAFIASGEMAVAYFMAHFGAGDKFWPVVNEGESAVLYCFLFLFIAAHGPGIWSVGGSARPRPAL